MEKFKNQFVNIPFELIKGCDNCYFLEDGRIYNVITKKYSKKRVKCSSVGYTINGSFVLNANIERIKVENLSNNKFEYFQVIESDLGNLLNTF